MTISTWSQTPFLINIGAANYSDDINWSAGVPVDIAEFKASVQTNISVNNDLNGVNEWLFSPGATQYSFEVTANAFLDFSGNGIIINSGSVKISNFGYIAFDSVSTAGGAVIDNCGILQFLVSSNAGTAVIHTFGFGAETDIFLGPTPSAATGGSAQFITDLGGIVDFSGSLGPDGPFHITAGSIAGAGAYELGGDQLTVGLNGLSTEVSGPIEDGGEYGGSGASLVKVGPGTLKLSHARNTYGGGTILEAGKLDIAAVGAAGPGAISFAGRATLAIENAALSGHVFGNAIDSFARHDVLDLAGLKFRAGAKATYHKANHHLTVHSGHVTDTLTLFSPHGTHFATASDHHGGTDVFLFFA